MNRRYILLIFTVLCLGITLCNRIEQNSKKILDNHIDAPRDELFRMYNFYFKKPYRIDSLEAIERFKHFNHNIDYIKKVNSKNLSYRLGIGPFTDMSNEEFREKILMNEDSLMQKLGNININNSSQNLQFLSNEKTKKKSNEANYQQTIDWGYTMRSARDQGVCGCCWAFATILTTEGNYFIKNQNETIYLSPQQLVDCNYSNKACIGGWPSFAFEYMKGAGNAREYDYPYVSGSTGRGSDCTYKYDGIQIVSGYSQCPLNNCDFSSWTNLLSQGPLTVAMDASSEDFQNYSSGVLDIKSCGSINHAVVAYGINADDQGPFLSIRNSWSKWWGNNGDFMIRYNSNTNTCGITSTGWLPQIQQGTPPAPDQNITCVTVYDQCDFNGNNLQLCKSTSDLTANNFANSITSIQINNSTEVTIYDDVNCCGNSVTFTSDESCMETDSNPNIKSMAKSAMSITIFDELPPSGCIWVYQDCCYSTGKQEFCNDVSDLTTYGLDDKISSIKFGPNVQSVIIFVQPNFFGLAYGLNNEIACLKQSDTRIFYSEVSSFRIIIKK